jgi:microcystin-dependent protein
MSTFTVSKNLEQVPRGGDLGTWDTPENSNWAIVDAALGQIVTIGLNNSNVVLSSPQYQCAEIIFNSTLTGSVTITFPSTFTGPYIIQNLCTGTSAFTITLQTTVAGGQVVACPPGDSFNAINDGTNLKYHNFGRIGSYWDYAGSSVPNWISACTVTPYLNCDGTTFSAATFPVLAGILGSTTLPDSKGRTRFALDQGAGRISSVATGFSGSSVGSGGGTQTTTLVTANLPPYTPSGVNTTANSIWFQAGGVNVGAGGNFSLSAGGAVTFTGNAQGGTSTPFTNLDPSYIGGLTMIRSA